MAVTILQPPELEHDKMMAKRFGQKIHPLGRIERRVAWNFLSHLAAGGWLPDAVLSDTEVKCADAVAVMEEAFNLDDCWIRFRSAKGTTHLVRWVFGNDGYDLVSDWQYTNGDPDGFDALVSAFDGEQFV